VTYSVGVRSFFFGATKSQKKVRDSQDPEIPIELGFQKVRYPARNEEPRNSSDGHRRLRENPENRCDPQEKSCHEVHPVTVLFRKRKSGVETRTYRLAQKSLTSLGEGKQTLTAVDRRNIVNRQVRA
jgi:hypothetical protein